MFRLVWIMITGLLMSDNIQSQVMPKIPNDLIQKLKIMAIESKEGIPGDVILKDMQAPLNSEVNDPLCPQQESSEKELVLLFTGEVNNASEQQTTLGTNVPRILENDLFKADDKKYQSLFEKDSNTILGLAKELTPDQNNKDEVLKNFGGLLILGASQKYNPQLINSGSYNDQINLLMANKIKDLNLSRDEQLKLISSMSSLLYDNYNNKRNVTTDSDNTPRYWATQGYGLFNPGNENMGGVCDDIAALGCQLFQSINPGEDCFTMHEAKAGGLQHFVMLVGKDGTENFTVIDGGKISETEGANYLSQKPEERLKAGGAVNIRLNRFKDGSHQTITLVKTEHGQWMQEVMDIKGKPGSSLVGELDGVTLKNIGAAYEKKMTERQSDVKTIKYGVNNGVLQGGSNVVAVYALLDKKTLRERMGIGLAYSYAFDEETYSNDRYINKPGQTIIQSMTDKKVYHSHQFHINPYYGLGRSFEINRGNNSLKIHYLNGVYANIMVGAENSSHMGSRTTTIRDQFDVNTNTDRDKYKTEPGIIYDGNLGLSQQVALDFNNQQTGTSVNVGVQVTEELGPRDMTRIHGIIAGAPGFFGAISKLNFHLNRLEARADFKQKIKENTNLMGSGSYLGTNVGAKYLAELGLEFDVPDQGMEIYVMTSYGASSGGFNSNQDFLPQNNNNGIGVRAGMKTNQGVGIDGRVIYDQSAPEPVKVQMKFKAPLDVREEQKPKDFYGK